MLGFVLLVIAGILGFGSTLLAVHVPGRSSIAVLFATLLFVYALLPISAFRVARHSGESYVPRRYNRWYVYLVLFVVLYLGTSIVASSVRTVVQAFKIPSGAMMPTLEIGDYVLVDKAIYRFDDPKRFDIIVFEYPEDPQKTFVMRVVALPGETVEIRSKEVMINGTVLAEPHVHFAEGKAGHIMSPRDSLGPFRVPEGTYFVLGDNRDRSYDSRFWGPVRRDKIFGQLKVLYFSWSAENFDVRWRRIGMPLR